MKTNPGPTPVNATHEHQPSGQVWRETAERLQKDKERLDWLSENSLKAWVWGNEVKFTVRCKTKEPRFEKKFPTLREAIDAAIAATKGMQ